MLVDPSLEPRRFTGALRALVPCWLALSGTACQKQEPPSDMRLDLPSVSYSRDPVAGTGHGTSPNLAARAGQASAAFKVDIVRKVVVEAPPIDANRRIYFSLDAGKYELTVKLASPKRMSVEWRGAPYCNASSDGILHVSTCGLHA